MKLKIQLFAALAHAAGIKELSLELPQKATVGDLMQCLAQQYPDWAPAPEHVSVAVNMEYAPMSMTLQQGDEVALIPPVSGG